MSLVKLLQDATGKRSIWDIVKQAGVYIALDGNWMETVAQLSGTKNVKLMGTDPEGNKYYQDITRPYGRHRWVVYKTLGDYNASSIHPHWHAWIHHIEDNTPVDTTVKLHKYAVNYEANLTGKPDTYLPKGSWKNQEQRNWMKTAFWPPP